MTTSGASERDLAASMMGDLRAAPRSALEMRGIDLGPAVEQVLFSSLRAGHAGEIGLRPRVRQLARRPVAALGALRAPQRLPRADVMVIALADVHRRLFAPVGAELGRIDAGISVIQVAAGRAAMDPRLADLPGVPRQLTRRSALALMRHRVDHRVLAAATAAWDGKVGAEVASSLRPRMIDTIGRLALEAARIDDTMAAVRPRAIVMYDEIDAWSRLVTTVAHRRGVTVVDLPHAEAVDADAIRGAGYDLMGVYGPRSAAVVAAAGVPDHRIVIVGPAGFDTLVRSARDDIDVPRRVVLAAQYRGGRMTDAVRRGVLASAVVAAREIDAAVELVPHPTEPVSAWDSILSERSHVSGVDVLVASRDALHDLLPGAALLVTGWSNSVYEAVLARVPAITVHLLEGPPPMPFAAEGIAREARDATTAAQHARALMVPEARRLALSTARAALAEHLGPLDGAATQRTAALVVRAAQV